MKDLADIGFYTLSNDRAARVSASTRLERCELLLTDACNFKCPYCRGAREGYEGTMPFSEASRIVKLWTDDNLRNIRFSGGEPTLYKNLVKLVAQAKDGGVERCAISTNGSADWELYKELIEAGVDDFSVSLDGGCCATGQKMNGGISGVWDKVISNIARISKLTYCTVGMVFTEDNVNECLDAVRFAVGLGVSDIRVIPSAQYNKALTMLADLEGLNSFPILKYRINNIRNGRHVRGIEKDDKTRCRLALDDMAVIKDEHFPCIIYLREGGDPIGEVGPNMRAERLEWVENHIPAEDSICSKNCLDVCVDYNHVAGRGGSI